MYSYTLNHNKGSRCHYNKWCKVQLKHQRTYWNTLEIATGH